MNWFQRHLNWTWFLGMISPYVLIFIAAFIAALAGFNIGIMTEPVARVIGYAIFFIVVIPLTLWVLKHKNRSFWWFLILFIPLIGWIIFLCLENRSDERRSPPEDKSPKSPMEPPKIPRGKVKVTNIDF